MNQTGMLKNWTIFKNSNKAFNYGDKFNRMDQISGLTVSVYVIRYSVKLSRHSLWRISCQQKWISTYVPGIMLVTVI